MKVLQKASNIAHEIKEEILQRIKSSILQKPKIKENTKMGENLNSQASSAGKREKEECQKMIQRSLRTPMVKFLKEEMEKAGCSFGDKFIKVVKCNKQMSGYYIPGREIRVCCSHMNIQDEVDQVVIQNLFHAYDDCRVANLDRTHRTNQVNGDCHFKRKLMQGFTKIGGHEQDCVRRRVMKFLMPSSPDCSETAAKEVIEAVGMFVTMIYTYMNQLY